MFTKQIQTDSDLADEQNKKIEKVFINGSLIDANDQSSSLSIYFSHFGHGNDDLAQVYYPQNQYSLQKILDTWPKEKSPDMLEFSWIPVPVTLRSPEILRNIKILSLYTLDNHLSNNLLTEITDNVEAANIKMLDKFILIHFGYNDDKFNPAQLSNLSAKIQINKYLVELYLPVIPNRDLVGTYNRIRNQFGNIPTLHELLVCNSSNACMQLSFKNDTVNFGEFIDLFYSIEPATKAHELQHCYDVVSKTPDTLSWDSFVPPGTLNNSWQHSNAGSSDTKINGQEVWGRFACQVANIGNEFKKTMGAQIKCRTFSDFLAYHRHVIAWILNQETAHHFGIERHDAIITNLSHSPFSAYRGYFPAIEALIKQKGDDKNPVISVVMTPPSSDSNSKISHRKIYHKEQLLLNIDITPSDKLDVHAYKYLRIEHPKPQACLKLYELATEAFNLIHSDTTLGKQEFLLALADMIYYKALAVPYYRGGAATVELELASTLKSRGYPIHQWNGDLPIDLLAIFSPSKEEFAKTFIKNLRNIRQYIPDDACEQNNQLLKSYLAIFTNQINKYSTATKNDLGSLTRFFLSKDDVLASFINNLQAIIETMGNNRTLQPNFFVEKIMDLCDQTKSIFATKNIYDRTVMRYDYLIKYIDEFQNSLDSFDFESNTPSINNINIFGFTK